MATGVPTKSAASASGEEMHLTYSGKADYEDVLRTPPAKSISLWGGRYCDKKRLYYGDNLPVLASLLTDMQVRGQVRLVYIDPPFSTQGIFLSRKQNHAYHDTLVGAEFVEFLRKRLILLRALLANDGSIYLHLDENMIFHIKVILDEVFGCENYRNCIVRQKCNPKN